MIRQFTFDTTITTTGSAGSATGSGRIKVPAGILNTIALDYSASAPNTTDVTIAHEDTRFGNILVSANSSTDAVFYPTTAAHTSAAAAVTNGYLPCYIADGYITIAVAGCDALAAALVVTVRVLAEV